MPDEVLHEFLTAWHYICLAAGLPRVGAQIAAWLCTHTGPNLWAHCIQHVLKDSRATPQGLPVPPEFLPWKKQRYITTLLPKVGCLPSSAAADPGLHTFCSPSSIYWAGARQCLLVQPPGWHDVKTRPAVVQVTAIEPVVEIARAAHAAGLPIAVASGGSTSNVRGGMKIAGIADFFEVVICAEVRSHNVWHRPEGA